MQTDPGKKKSEKSEGEGRNERRGEGEGGFEMRGKRTGERFFFSCFCCVCGGGGKEGRKERVVGALEGSCGDAATCDLVFMCPGESSL